MQYIAATDTITKLREAIDLHLYSDALRQLQQRTWLLHWSLFIYWNVDDGCTQLLDLFMHDMFTVAMQINSPHLLRCTPFSYSPPTIGLIWVFFSMLVNACHTSQQPRVLCRTGRVVSGCL